MTCDRVIFVHCPFGCFWRERSSWEAWLDAVREHTECCDLRPHGYDRNFTVLSTEVRTAKSHTVNVTALRGLKLDPPYDASADGGGNLAT